MSFYYTITSDITPYKIQYFLNNILLVVLQIILLSNPILPRVNTLLIAFVMPLILTDLYIFCFISIFDFLLDLVT